MKKFVTLVLALSLMFVFASCGSQKADDGAEESEKITTTEKNTDPNRVETSENSTGYVKDIYENNRIVSKDIYDENNNLLNRAEVEYNENNDPVRTVITDGQGYLTGIEEISYYSNGNKKRLVRYSYEGAQTNDESAYISVLVDEFDENGEFVTETFSETN